MEFLQQEGLELWGPRKEKVGRKWAEFQQADPDMAAGRRVVLLALRVRLPASPCPSAADNSEAGSCREVLGLETERASLQPFPSRLSGSGSLRR